MKIVIIHGQNHKGTTYCVARKLVHKIKQQDRQKTKVKEFFLPRDFDKPCLGCGTCFHEDLTHCPHFEKLKPLSDAILAADVLIFDSPVYVYHATGQMMSFLDHFGTWWMVHRPRVEMTRKQAVVISTAAGGGMNSTNRDMADSLEMWGVRRIYRLGFGVRALKPEEVPVGVRQSIDQKTQMVADQIVLEHGMKGMNLKGKKWFYAVRTAHIMGFSFAPDRRYWGKQGWFGAIRPWD